MVKKKHGIYAIGISNTLVQYTLTEYRIKCLKNLQLVILMRHLFLLQYFVTLHLNFNLIKSNPNSNNTNLILILYLTLSVLLSTVKINYA